MGSLSDFMGAARPVLLNGNSVWAQRYAADIRRAWTQAGEHHPRSLQVHLGPSELGVDCHRQVAGKFAQAPRTNHVIDPWPSMRGTALHSYAEDRVFPLDNEMHGRRWESERRVTPHPDHAGTADLYDHWAYSVDDHKFLGDSSMDKVRRAEGPPVKYQRQLKLYGRGYKLEGFRVDRIVLIAYPATRGSLDDLYVWEHEWHPSDEAELDWLLYDLTPYRKAWGDAIAAGQASLMDVPADPNRDECYFCPFYRPQAATDGGLGCPGHAERV